jgi:lipid A 3-O-deacylase
MFHESAGVGVHLDGHWSALLAATRTSNAGLRLDNGGITDFGVKIGYAF